MLCSEHVKGLAVRVGGLVRVLHAACAVQAEVRDPVRKRFAGGGAQPGGREGGREGRGARLNQLLAQLRARGCQSARPARAALHRTHRPVRFRRFFLLLLSSLFFLLASCYLSPSIAVWYYH